MDKEWNISKLSALRQCHRKFYFSYELPNFHFTHPVRRKAYELSKVQTLKMWQGTLVDQTITKKVIPIYKNKALPDYEKIADELVATAMRQFNFSSNQFYRLRDIPKTEIGDDFLILDIHESGSSHLQREINEVYESVHKIIVEFPKYLSPDQESTMGDYLSKSTFLRPDARNLAYVFEDIKIKPQIDLVRYLRNKVDVIDWKVSDNEVADYSKQLILEGVVTLHYLKNFYKRMNWLPIPSLGDVALFEVNLMNGNIKRHAFTKESAAIALDYVYLFQDEQEQLAQGHAWNELNIDEYERTDKIETCVGCKFKFLCKHLVQNNFVYDEDKYYKLVQAQKLA